MIIQSVWATFLFVAKFKRVIFILGANYYSKNGQYFKQLKYQFGPFSV